MKKPLFKARQLLVLAYLLAAVFWVVRCLVGCGVMLNYKMQGKMPQTPSRVQPSTWAASSSSRGTEL